MCHVYTYSGFFFPSIKKQPLRHGFIVGTCQQGTFHRYQTEEGRIYYSADYGRVKTRNSFTIGYVDSITQSTEYGQIMHFTRSEEPVALVRKFSILNARHHFQLTFDSLNSRLFPVSPTDSDNIVEKCILENVCYIARFNRNLFNLSLSSSSVVL